MLAEIAIDHKVGKALAKRRLAWILII